MNLTDKEKFGAVTICDESGEVIVTINKDNIVCKNGYEVIFSDD